MIIVYELHYELEKMYETFFFLHANVDLLCVWLIPNTRILSK